MSKKKLAVVIGAGASFDCISEDKATARNSNYRPPLVDQLFEKRGLFNDILKKYTKAETVSGQIRTKLAPKSGVTLETLLRDLTAIENINAKRQFWEVPLYLQELLGTVSYGYIQDGSSAYNYLLDTLLTRSNIDEILFLALNYDLFLEKELETIETYEFNNIYDYLPSNKKWSLIKLHGSVNWGIKIKSSAGSVNFRSGVQVLNSLDSEIEYIGSVNVLQNYKIKEAFREEVRFAKDGEFMYPAIAIPVQDKTGYICPTEHIGKAKDFLKDCTNLLCIGFSGNDKHVLELLAENMSTVHKYKFVCGTVDGSKDLCTKLASYRLDLAYTRDKLEDYVHNGGFSNFVYQGGLESFLKSIDLPTTPASL